MLFRMKDEKAHQLEAELDKLQADGPAAWAKLPEEELFTPAGFSEERAEATSYSNYSYWGSTFRAFFKNRVAVLLLVALIAVGVDPVGDGLYLADVLPIVDELVQRDEILGGRNLNREMLDDETRHGQRSQRRTPH